jgi:hypothetical protein
MKKFSYVVVGFLFFALSCAKERPRDIFKKMNKAIEKKDENALKNCYTQETQDLFAKLDELQGSPFPWYTQIIQSGVQQEPKVISEKVEKGKAVLTVEQNQRQLNLTLVKDKDQWKLDLTKKLSMILSVIEQQKKMMEEKSKGKSPEKKKK